MPILHIQTDEVRAAGRHLLHTAQEVHWQARRVDNAFQVLLATWQGDARAEFAGGMDHWLYTLRRLATDAAELSLCVGREADEWEAVDRQGAAMLVGVCSPIILFHRQDE